MRIATRTTPTCSRYGRKKPTIRRIVAPRRSLGTGVKSRAAPPRPPPPIRPPPRAPPPVAARVPPARGKLTTSSPSGGGRGLGDPLGLQPAFRVDGRLAAIRGRGDGLAIAMVVDIAGDEHAVDLR